MLFFFFQHQNIYSYCSLILFIIIIYSYVALSLFLLCACDGIRHFSIFFFFFALKYRRRKKKINFCGKTLRWVKIKGEDKINSI